MRNNLDAEVEKQVLEIVNENGLDPVDTQMIASRLKMSWGCANRLLLAMSLKGKLTALKTSGKYFVFLPPVTITLKANA